MTTTLRPYQEDCARAVVSDLATYDSTLVEAATGTGKTVIFCAIALRWPTPVLIIAHREELIAQAAQKVHEATGTAPGVEMAEASIARQGLFALPKVVVASVQTLSQPGRLGAFPRDAFGLVVVDEAHHAVAVTYRRVLDYFRAKRLGVSATPKRADDVALGQVFQSVAFRYGIVDAVDDGWLVPVSQQCVKVEGLDFSAVRSLAGDFNEGELERILTEETILHKVAAPTVQLSGDCPALVFCCTVKHAELMSAVLGRYKPGSSAWLSGATSKEVRRETVQRYKDGKLQFLCNCGLFLEGFDAPVTSVVVMARPTKSAPLYAQVLGRGTRPLPGVVDGVPTAEGRKAAIAASPKRGMLALDFVGNAGRHKIVTAADVLGGRYGIPVRDYARETVSAENRPVPVAEALDRAEAELALANAMAERRRRILARAEYQTREVSPFDRRQATSGLATALPLRGEPATDKQVWKLHKAFGVPLATARAYTKRQASAVIDKYVRQQEATA
jgi:superfamily II DNA or RNA helicase